MNKNKTNIANALVVDDNDNFRASCIEYLNFQSDLNIVGEAKNGREAIKLIRKLNPDIVFMDISMPKMDGLTAAHLIKEKFPSIKVVIITIHEKEIFKVVADSLAVDGFISKSSISEELPKLLKKLEVYSEAAVG
jgi:DNA-binding NarL/FixJ family response regulator